MVDCERLQIQIKNEVNTVYEELKHESENYAEFYDKCMKFYMEIRFKDRNLGRYVKSIFEELMRNELKGVQNTRPSDNI